MKLRIQPDSLTLRLSPEELQTFSENGLLSQTTRLSIGEVRVRLQAESCEQIEASFEEGAFTFSLPERHLTKWLNSSKIGYSSELDETTITIEKDLPRKKKH